MLSIPSPSCHFLSSLNSPAFIPELQRVEKMLNFKVVSAPSICQAGHTLSFPLLIIQEAQEWFVLQVCIFPFLDVSL